MSLIKYQNLFILDVARLIMKSVEFGVVLTAGELYRTETQAWINSLPQNSNLTAIDPDGQKYIYSKPAGGVGIYLSSHRNRLAVDFNFFILNQDGIYELLQNRNDERIIELGKFWKSLDPQNFWGGDFRKIDIYHFERKII